AFSGFMLRIFEKIVDNYKVDPGKLDSLVLRKGLIGIYMLYIEISLSHVLDLPGLPGRGSQ
ncbi:MAG: hypothetical protein LHW57_07430, partial [Candidatus Cloacimonetes bacterium]|nr:hypothetical protein [Candidatus Cloacimonadota bacterium]